MKKYIFMSILAGCMLAWTSCKDFLDMEYLLDDTLDLNDVFTSKDYSDEWLAGIYSHLTGGNMDVSSKRASPFNMISDDMYFNDSRKANDNGRTYESFKNGQYTEGWEQGSWGSCYRAIRDASTYIHNIDKCPESQLTPDEVRDRKAQARFLRAYYYWLLLRKYGPIPILPDQGVDFTKDYNDLALPRNTYDECADFITSELALAAQDLDLQRDNRNIARPTKGAALAARAKVYLYAASPLFNGNTDAWADKLVNNEGQRLTSPVYDESKWAKAAAAAKEVMDLGVYKIFTVDFREDNGLLVTREESGSIGTPTTKNPLLIPTWYHEPKTIVPPYHPVYSEKNWPEGWKDIDPFRSYSQLFNGDLPAFNNPELIFTRGQNQNWNDDIVALTYHQFPRSLGGWNTHGLTLKTYDAYYMNDGSEFPSDNRPKGYTTAQGNPNYTEETDYLNYRPLPPNVSLAHANREPRFYASVAFNGSIWECESLPIAERNSKFKQVFYYRDNADGDGKKPGEAQFYLPTGIGIKKYVNSRDGEPNRGGRWYSKVEPAIRYAEVLLIYVEALNELTATHTIPTYDGKGSIIVSRDANEMRKGILPIRLRAGLPDFDNTAYSNANSFRIKLKRERQIELMGEGHRYFDLRRWKEDARVEESTPIKGFNMNMPSTEREWFDNPVEVTTLPAVFVDKMYLWPIDLGELKKNRKLTQNPGWNTFTD